MIVDDEPPEDVEALVGSSEGIGSNPFDAWISGLDHWSGDGRSTAH
jgi:hypothetical protein